MKPAEGLAKQGGMKVEKEEKTVMFQGCNARQPPILNDTF